MPYYKVKLVMDAYVAKVVEVKSSSKDKAIAKAIRESDPSDQDWEFEGVVGTNIEGRVL